MRSFNKSKHHLNTLIVFTLLLLLSAIENKSYSQIEKVDTVGTTWQISRGLDIANHQYTDVPVYNANGSMALFKDKKGIYYISKGLTSYPEKVNFKEKPLGKVEWDFKRPNILYYLTKDKSFWYLWSFNVKTSNAEMIYKTENHISEISPAHPDGDHLLLGAKDKDESVLEVYSISEDESIKIPIDVPMHRIRFTKSPDLTIFINRSAEPKTSWLVDVNTKEKTQIFQGKSTSPSWRLGGKNFCFYGNDVDGERKLLVLNTDGEIIKVFPGLTNHHLGWSIDGKFIVTDVEEKKEGLYVGWICVINFETGEIQRVVKHQSDFDEDDGDKNSSGHPHPQLSPDATKVVYNSSRYGIDYPHVFVSLVRLPEHVKDTSIKKAGENIELSWTKASGLEIENYLVYRKYKDGNTKLVATLEKDITSFIEKDNKDLDSYYIVSKEYSGLESKPVVLNKE
ncbi:MAG: oligogalacturonate lyase family protein [Bacteroidetes bacterium]|nr:oligogalacturonate lyase family protein [Bacteroidota bacterium]